MNVQNKKIKVNSKELIFIFSGVHVELEKQVSIEVRELVRDEVKERLYKLGWECAGLRIKRQVGEEISKRYLTSFTK